MDAMPGARSLAGVNMDRLKNLRQKALREHGLNPGDQKSSIWKFETIIDKHEEQELAIVGEEGKQPTTTCVCIYSCFQVSRSTCDIKLLSG